MSLQEERQEKWLQEEQRGLQAKLNEINFMVKDGADPNNFVVENSFVRKKTSRQS